MLWSVRVPQTTANTAGDVGRAAAAAGQPPPRRLRAPGGRPLSTARGQSASTPYTFCIGILVYL